MKWQVPVALACEQRAEDNLTIIEEIRHRCNLRIDPDALANPDFLDYLFQKQYADALLEFLTPKEHEVIVKYYLGQETLQMIADAMHIKKQQGWCSLFTACAENGTSAYKRRESRYCGTVQSDAEPDCHDAAENSDAGRIQ